MKTLIYSYLFVALGGALGAVARFSLNLLLQRDVDYPWGTLTSNLLGCFVMGGIAWLVASSSWFNEIGVVPDQYRLLLAVGFCGSFTTLSTLVLELHHMLGRGEHLAAGVYLGASVVGGYLLFFAGLLLMRGILPANA